MVSQGPEIFPRFLFVSIVTFTFLYCVCHFLALSPHLEKVRCATFPSQECMHHYSTSQLTQSESTTLKKKASFHVGGSSLKNTCTLQCVYAPHQTSSADAVPFLLYITMFCFLTFLEPCFLFPLQWRFLLDSYCSIN